MQAWQLTTDSLREVDHARNRVRRLDGINPPTEAEAPNGKWHDYLDITTIEPGQPLVIVWPYPGQTPGTRRITRTSATVVVLDRRPQGPWGWAVESDGDGDGPTIGRLVLDGDPAAGTADPSAAFVLANVLNAAEAMPERPDQDGAICLIEINGIPALVVAGSPVAIITGGKEVGPRIATLLARWSRHPSVLAGLAAAAAGATGWEMKPAWTFSDPMVARAAIIGGGLSDKSVEQLDEAGDEAWREAARIASLLGEALPWREAVRAIGAPVRAGGPTLMDLVASGRVVEADQATVELLQTALEAGARQA